MAAAKEIRTKIQSIKNTQKITSAMEMVAASKMRKAQDRMATSRPYATRIQQVIGHLAWGHSEYHHPYLAEREVKERVGFIVVSTDRGLCGGLNANLFKKIINEILELKEKKIEVELCIIGKKAEAFFKRFNNIAAVTTNLGDAPSVEALIGVIKVMLDKYDDNKLDALHLFYNEFENTMSQRPAKIQLLPLLATEAESEEFQHHWDYIYEPDAKELLDVLLTRYIESQVYQAVVENIASEQAARMVAMKSATDNAGELINEFQLVYNKARQAAITQEISEIVGGAAAV